MSLPVQDADKSQYASHILHVTHAALTQTSCSFVVTEHGLTSGSALNKKTT